MNGLTQIYTPYASFIYQYIFVIPFTLFELNNIHKKKKKIESSTSSVSNKFL